MGEDFGRPDDRLEGQRSDSRRVLDSAWGGVTNNSTTSEIRTDCYDDATSDGVR